MMSLKCKEGKRPRTRRILLQVAFLGGIAVSAGPTLHFALVAEAAEPSAAAFQAPPGIPGCFEGFLFDNTFHVALCVEAEPGLPWHASADLDSFPIEVLTRFLPPSAERIHGGYLSGSIELRGQLAPADPQAPNIRCTGTLRADSLWWSVDPPSEAGGGWVLADLILHLQLGVRTGGAAAPFQGDLEGEGGTVRYWGHEFPVSVFRISFLDSTRFGPLVDLVASTQIISHAGTKYRVQLELKGPAARSRPALQSHPPLTTSDIQSLMALGIPLSAFSDEQITLRTSPYWAQQIFLLRALKVAAERIVGLAEERAETLLGLDEVRVPTPADQGGTAGEMEIAKRLGGRATLSYISPVWHSSGYRVRLDLRLSEHFFLESENDQTGDSGVDLRFKMRFR